MAGQRTPGPIGTDTGPTVRIDSGTSALMATPAPGGVCAAPENGLQGPAYALDLQDLGWVDTLHATQAVWSALEQSWDHAARIVRQETDVVIDGIVHLILPILALGIAVLVASFVFSGGLFALGLALLEWLGLGFLAFEIGCSLAVVGGYTSRGARRAVNSLFVPSHQRSGEITLAAIDFARAQAELIKAVLMGIVALVLKNSAVTSSRKAGLPELLGNLRKSRLGEGFAGWVEGNWQALMGNSKLRPPVQRSAAPPRPAEVFTPSQLARRTPTPEPATPVARPPAPVTHPLGQITGKYTAMDATGPLPDNMAGTFSGGRYTAVKLEQDTILYRAGTAEQPLGQYFSQESPASVIQTRIDKAVLPEWPGGSKSPLDTLFAVKVPAGTEVYIGEVGSQGGFYVGGTQQIVVVKPWAIDGVQVLGATPLP